MFSFRSKIYFNPATTRAIEFCLHFSCIPQYQTVGSAFDGRAISSCRIENPFTPGYSIQAQRNLYTSPEFLSNWKFVSPRARLFYRSGLNDSSGAGIWLQCLNSKRDCELPRRNNVGTQARNQKKYTFGCCERTFFRLINQSGYRFGTFLRSESTAILWAPVYFWWR